MAKKHLNIDELKNTIIKMVKEEVEVLAKEQSLFGTEKENDEVNPYFDKVRDKEGFVDWIMSYYFKPANKNKPWFSDTVNKDNVLQFLSKTKSNFPLSPRELVDDWFLKRSLKQSMSNIKDKDLETVSQEVPKDVNDYHKGVTPLKSIASDLDVTVAAAQKIEADALQKLQAAMNTGKGLNFGSEERAEQFFDKVDAVRAKLAVEFADSISESRGDINKLVADLQAKGLITPKFLKAVTPREVETLVFLATERNVDQIEEFLLKDAEENDNILKLFQMAVSKKVFSGVSGKRPGESSEED